MDTKRLRLSEWETPQATRLHPLPPYRFLTVRHHGEFLSTLAKSTKHHTTAGCPERDP